MIVLSSLKHRRRYGLESLIDPWIVSGDLGIRKPEPAIFQILLARTGLSAENCMFVDDRAEMLDMAWKLGFETVHFGNKPGADIHSRVSSFAELGELILSLRG